MKVSFELTMPNIGSWNGKWTGARKKYYVIKSAFKHPRHEWLMSEYIITKLLNGQVSRGFYYDFGDGWSANVRMEIVDAKEARKRMKESAGFCGYEWMIDSILKHEKIIVEDKILNPTP